MTTSRLRPAASDRTRGVLSVLPPDATPQGAGAVLVRCDSRRGHNADHSAQAAQGSAAAPSRERPAWACAGILAALTAAIWEWPLVLLEVLLEVLVGGAQ